MNDLHLFINRKQELNFLKQDILKARSRSRLLLISAYTGIGKSALMDQVLPEFAQPNQFRISISIDKKSEIQNGYLLKQITKLIHHNAQRNKSYLTIYEFINSDRFYKNVANGVVKAILGYLELYHFSDGYKEKNKEVTNNIKTWLGDDDELLDVCYRYVLFIAQEHKLFLTVENFQIADNGSILLIRDLLINTSNIYFAGECTLSADDDKVAEYLELYGTENIDVNNLRLEKLDKDELLNSIKNEKDILIGIIERTYENSDGNLHKFKLLRNTSHLKSFDVKVSNYNNITKILINNLDDISLGLLTIILSHQSNVPIPLLDFYLKYSPSFEFIGERYSQKLSDLQQLNLIKIFPDRIIIEHDSISLELRNMDKVRKIQAIATRNWIRVYQYLERNTIKYEIDYIDNLLCQIYFILQVESFEELLAILEKLNKFISISPTYNIVFQLDKIADSCKKYAFDELNSEVYKWLIIMYYRCGFGDKVINISSPALLTDVTILLCYLAALSTYSHDQVFEALIELDSDRGSALWLGLILIKIRTLRSSDNFDECKRIWIEHYKKGTFKNTPFYAGFLKYSTLAEHDDYNLRITCLNEAMKLFKLLNDKYGQISTCIALSRDSAYVGNIENCRNYLAQAEELANMSVYPRYQLYNNRAVFDIITENINQLTKDSLNNSLRICSNNGDKLIILSNILIISIIERDTVYGYTIYSKLQKEILNEFDRKDTITHLCLYNCYRYALMAEEHEQAEYLLGYLHQLDIRQDKELWNYLLYDTGENRYSQVIRKEYYPTFMLSWDLDYYIALSNFQPIISEHH